MSLTANLFIMHVGPSAYIYYVIFTASVCQTTVSLYLYNDYDDGLNQLSTTRVKGNNWSDLNL